ncbi:outer membrane lipoprotein-sorting protein [bacterium]|nr:outer membrane lipoprotein-sorting protein [bacterium]MBU1064676.1 outer membrane lipoprotein-sorting protein [bacterium]MBU1634937.1 outer membrane lipoprotein-sorting protein [bacterium]MBU1875344.1 outer membrane lipoprotein-sorting protein [bacterium]
MRNTLLFIIIFALLIPVNAQTPSGEEILKQIDRNQVFDQAISTSTMIVHSRTGDRTIQSKAWSSGNDKAFVEYLAPAREKGKKMLKLEKSLWIYTPEPSDRVITISGHLLKQSVMGSDMSYEDMMESDELRANYDANVLGKEIYNERECWVLELTANNKEVSYYSRKIWVDAGRWLPLKEERFAKSGKLLKMTEIREVFQQDGRWLPKRMTFKDMLSRGGGTEYIIDSIDFNVDIPDYRFTKAALRK